MQKKYSFIRVLCSLFLTTLLLSGCVSEPQEPDVTAKAYYDLFILGDSAEIENMGMPKDEVDELIEQEKKAMSSSLTTSLSAAGYTINDDKVQELTDALLKSLSKLTATTELVSKDDETSTVKISSNHIDLINLCTEAANSAIEDVKNLKLTSETEAQKKYLDVYVDKVIEKLNTVEPSTDVTEKTFDFNLKTVESDGIKYKIWCSDDMFQFGLEIGKIAMGVK